MFSYSNQGKAAAQLCAVEDLDLAKRLAAGLRDGPLGTAQDTRTSLISSRKS
jgi:hypothetical protein